MVNLPKNLSSTSLRAIGKLTNTYECKLLRRTNKELDCLYIEHISGDAFIDLDDDDIDGVLLKILADLEITGVITDLNEEEDDI